MRLAEFGSVQAVVQFLNAVAGLVIVHTLSKSEYALFAVANSMQTACNLLADVGIGVGVRSIGGRVWNDPARFGALVNTAIGMRRQFAVASFGVCLPVTAWMLWANEAPWWAIAALCAVVIAGALPLLAASVYGEVPQLHGEYRLIQKLDFGNAALRVVLIGVLAVSWMNAVLAAIVGAVSNWLRLVFLRRWARRHAQADAPQNTEDRREFARLSLKSLPNTIFFCFQGQVTLLILTFLGSPTAIADVTALGRLAALLAVFSVVFSNILAPRFSRCQDPSQMARIYLLLVGATMLVLAPLAVASWFVPEPFLWLLGDKYASLGAECGWMVTAGCVGQVLGVMWGLNVSKAWIRFQAAGYILTIITCQVVAALLLDLREFRDVLIFNLVTASAPLPLFLADALHGLRAARNAGDAR